MKVLYISEYFQTFPIYFRDEKQGAGQEMTRQKLEVDQRAM